MNDYYLDINAFDVANNILNIPINENYYNNRNESIVFDEEKKDDDFNNQIMNFQIIKINIIMDLIIIF